jgi:opacity protein-like surface antigen
MSLVLQKMAWIAPLALLVAVPAQAQDPRVELQGWAGWTFSDGVSGDPRMGSDGNIYNRVDPKNSVSYGLSIGFFVTENVEVGFLWDRQDSTLVATGNIASEVSPLNLDNYHGFVSYNFGDVDDPVRPYVLGGLGATRYSNVTIMGLGNDTRDVPSSSRFSTTWDVGVKLYPAPNFGIVGGVRWTPTYIKTDAGGWWCDPWWGCWVVGNAQYANQFEFHGGIALRF